MNIEYLADHPEFITELANLHFAEWSHLNPGESLAQRTDRLRRLCGRHGVPSFLVAFDGSELIGSASLIERDMDNHTELTPWLADVFVKPGFRRRGIASLLIRRIEDVARSAGISNLYLYTPSAASLYRRLGWTAVEHCRYKGIDVVIMSRTLR